jgi:hypothetical protein
MHGVWLHLFLVGAVQGAIKRASEPCCLCEERKKNRICITALHGVTPFCSVRLHSSRRVRLRNHVDGHNTVCPRLKISGPTNSSRLNKLIYCVCKNLLLHIISKCAEKVRHMFIARATNLYVRQVNLATYRRLSSIATEWLIPSIEYTSPSDDVTRKRELGMAWNMLRGDRIADTRYESDELFTSATIE